MTRCVSTIDHDERRQQIAQAAIDVIAREGLDAATIRRIAAEVGFSTTAVTHYFANKQELLVWTYGVLAREGIERFQEAFAADPADTLACMMTMTPWCAANVRRWKSYLAFWDLAARDPIFAAEHLESTQDGLASIARLVQARDDGSIDVPMASRLLNALVQGISLQIIVNRQAWPPDKIRRHLGEAIDMVLNTARTQGKGRG